MKKVLLDTNAYSALLKGDEIILNAIGEADIVFVSVVMLGELYAGFCGGTREADNRKLLNSFLLKSTVRILSVSKETAEIFGTIKHQLKSTGTPVPINDVWIAAHAMESGSRLITYDQHFKQIPGVLLWSK
ncbi:MAG: type II toxin-antitoxin system VapC family toxin [Kiritimatiellia bacterium]